MSKEEAQQDWRSLSEEAGSGMKERHAFVVTRDELRNYLRPRHPLGEAVSLLEQRRTVLQRLAALRTVI